MAENESHPPVPGNWFAHYTTASAAFEHILPSGLLRMSPYRVMRDPVENKEGPSLAGALPSDALWEAVQLAREMHQGARLLSMTRDALDYFDGTHDWWGIGWARPRLWEQYADEHRGVCLVFQRTRFEPVVREHFRRLGVTCHLGEVSYTPSGYAGSNGKVLPPSDERFFDPDRRGEAVIEHIERHFGDFFFLKTDDWSTEYEYRAVILGQSDDYAFVPFQDSLAAVILGEKFPAWQVLGAVHMAADHGVPILQLQWLGGRPVPAPLGPTQPNDDDATPDTAAS
jgi:hypothetical protein